VVAASAAVPTFIKTAHFGNLRGLDQHCQVAGLIMIGRPMPPPADVERIAGSRKVPRSPGPVVRFEPAEWRAAASREIRAVLSSGIIDCEGNRRPAAYVAGAFEENAFEHFRSGRVLFCQAGDIGGQLPAV
jgi:hypothetical protein